MLYEPYFFLIPIGYLLFFISIILFYPCFWVRVLAGGVGASPQELHVTEYGVSLLLRAIELGVSAGTMVSPSRAT